MNYIEATKHLIDHPLIASPNFFDNSGYFQELNARNDVKCMEITRHLTLLSKVMQENK